MVAKRSINNEDMSVRYIGVNRSEHVVMSNVKHRENRCGRKHKGSCREWKSEQGNTIPKMQRNCEVDG